jgi:serine acetyltransferase
MRDKQELTEHLKICLQREVAMNSKSFSWIITIHKAFKCPERRFNFWWRIASYLYKSGGKLRKEVARKINRKLIQKYNTEIQLSATIGPGLHITHYLSIAINGAAKIGANFKIRHNSTIGIGGTLNKKVSIPQIVIGNNVEIGAGSCILGRDIKIGNNVIIGAMSFINKDIPDNTIAYTEKSLKLTTKMHSVHSD